MRSAFCVGGTLLAAALAVLRRETPQPRGERYLPRHDARLQRCRGVFRLSHRRSLRFQARKRISRKAGVLHGRELALTFSSLRPNDLIWNYVVNNYLKGRKPQAFDLLYWNSDSTNLPGAMFVLLRAQHLSGEQSARPGQAEPTAASGWICRKIRLPDFRPRLAGGPYPRPGRAPTGPRSWWAAKSSSCWPPAGMSRAWSIRRRKNRRHYWLNPALPPDPDAVARRRARACRSWWNRWSEWLAGYGGGSVAARTEMGSARYPAIEPAPGRYVKQRGD